MSDHTPGPWEAAECGDYSDFDGDSRVVCSDDRRIAVVQHHGTIEDDANACLIAAAPDLLDLVIQYRDDLKHPPTGNSYARRMDAINAALAKVFASVSEQEPKRD